jgi:hypothetical protein
VTDPAPWSNFFILVGTGAATLAGLVVVAMTINLRGIAGDGTHRFRAINMLTGFTSVLVLSALALMGAQTARWIGVEWLAVAVAAAVVNTNGYIQGARQRGSSRYALSPLRVIGGSACYAGQIVGAALLVAGIPAGAYVAAVALVVNFLFLVSGSWLLILGTLEGRDRPTR